MKSYSDVIKMKSFIERYEYLRLFGRVGIETFGFDRYLNQALYKSSEWRKTRDKVIIRDSGCDLGIADRPISGTIIIHHINPIKEDDIINRNSALFDLDNLICTSINTHNAIHYGDASLLIRDPIIRLPNDTCPWRTNK